MTDLFDIEGIRQWADYRAPKSSVDERGKVFVTVPVAIWNQLLSDVAGAADEIEKFQEGAA